MVFCISRTKSLKSLVPGNCGCSSGADVAFPGCLLRFPTLCKRRRRKGRNLSTSPPSQSQHTGHGGACGARAPVQGRGRPAGPAARPPRPALPRRLPGPCSHGPVLRVAGTEGPPASEVIGERAELSPGPAVWGEREGRVSGRPLILGGTRLTLADTGSLSGAPTPDGPQGHGAACPGPVPPQASRARAAPTCPQASLTTAGPPGTPCSGHALRPLPPALWSPGPRPGRHLPHTPQCRTAGAQPPRKALVSLCAARLPRTELGTGLARMGPRPHWPFSNLTSPGARG